MRALALGLVLIAGTAQAERVVTAERQAAEAVKRIERLDSRLNSVVALTSDWRAQARTLDRQPASGPLHGRPILIKDNIETRELPTTAGSLALAANNPGRDAPLVARLRAAGALILGKTNLSEWANFRSSRSMSGWSAVGGMTRNAYALDRTACGSSSGSAVAVAAGLAWGAVGTETDGSIVCPASQNGVVGLKPTLGLVSRTLVVPLSHSQDTPGPMARTVRDAALLLGAMAGRDPADPATVEADARRVDYAAGLRAGVRGVRIGVLREGVGSNPAVAQVFDGALAHLRASGAELVDIPKTGRPDGLGTAEFQVLLTEFKVGLNAYLAAAPPRVSVRSLAQLIGFNEAKAAREMPYFGQETLIAAEATKGLEDPAYLKALATSRTGARATLDRLLKDNHVTILVAPTTGPAWPIDPVRGDQGEGPSASGLPAMSGYPHLTVPMGQIRGLPIGLSFIGPAWSEAALLAAGQAFEFARGPLPAPTLRPTIPVD